MYMCDKLDRHVNLHDTTAVILEKKCAHYNKAILMYQP